MNDEFYMQRCLELAKLGSGKVAPNPMVGAILVHLNRIIGEGYHQQFGNAHAEVNCIDSVKEEDKILIPPELLTEICYENFIQQPVNTMENIYHKLNLGDFGYCKEAITLYADSQKTYKVLDHQSEADEVNMIQQLAPYIEYWKILKNVQRLKQ